MVWLDIRNYVTAGSLDSIGESLSRLGTDPSANMLAGEGDLLMFAIRRKSADVVRMLWDYCKANFLTADCTVEDFDAMIDVFYEVANNWEAAYKNTEVLGVINAIQEELDNMDAQMQTKSKTQCETQSNTDYTKLANLTPRSSGSSSEGPSRESTDLSSWERIGANSEETCFPGVKYSTVLGKSTDPLPIQT